MTRTLWAFVGVCVVTVGVSAQSYPEGQGSTRPTTPAPSTQAPPTTAPTTPAPAQNTVKADADKKVTLSGCIERQPPSAAAVTGAANMPFTLTNASPAGARAPVGTAGSTPGAATAASAKSYRLDGSETVLSPHVGHKVEITGMIEEQPASPATGAAAAGASTAAAAKLKVDSVKMVSTNCQ